MALVSAANVMEIAAMAIHTPVSAGRGRGRGCSRTGGAATAGGGEGGDGGEATVVTAARSPRAHRCGGCGLHQIVRAGGGGAPPRSDTVLVGTTLHDGRPSAEIVERRWRGRGPLERG